MFERVLVANRGEIACRVMATARRLGISTVAVYSEADAGARHVALADDARAIGPAPPRDSYLNIENIIAAALDAGAQAVHPGYGFLAENADFAEACTGAGLVFIGPGADAMRVMGLKDRAKEAMEKAGVPVVPGYHGADQSEQVLAKAAGEIGFPVLIKAVAGGGGKGLRRVNEKAEFSAALEGARREASSAFGVDRVLVEKWIVGPRHIEIQVFADSHGNAVHLFERDCSLQRRHQKVMEEAPAPGMPADLRERMGESAVAAARAIGYQGAGTVEFIVEAAHGLDSAAFYFMEMNTRLQVEHPVTELVTGQDLVEWQFRVAAGEALPLAQDELAIEGHAVEARLYAEDPARNFLPSTGVLKRLRLGREDPHLRIDTGVREGDEVTVHYDPMIAKIIAWDRDRASALKRLRAALGECQVAGVATNIAFLRRVAGHQGFVDGGIDTEFISDHWSELVPEADHVPGRVLALASLYLLLERQAQAAADEDDPFSPWASASGWRLNGEGHDLLRFAVSGRDIEVKVHYRDGGYIFDLPDGALAARGELGPTGELDAVLDGARLAAAVLREGRELTIMCQGGSHRLVLHDPLDTGALDETAGGAVVAPMPGRILSVNASPGEQVRGGQTLVIMEAMKMEHTLTAPFDALVERVNVEAGDQVEEGSLLLEFARSDGAE